MRVVRRVAGVSSPDLEVLAGSREHAPPAPEVVPRTSEVPMPREVTDAAPLLFEERLARWLADVAESAGRYG
jgi:hypothetical protein